jgi:hypothetical protein
MGGSIRLATAAMLLVLSVAPTLAFARPYTLGEAKAALEGVGSGGVPGNAYGLIAGNTPMGYRQDGVVIRPWLDHGYNGAHVCGAEYHVLIAAWWDMTDPEFNSFVTRQDVADALDAVRFTFILDGQKIETTRTQSKPLPGIVNALVFNEGRIMAPGDLTVGHHTFGIEVIDPTYGNFDDGIEFDVDPAGSPSCDH